MSTLMSSGGSSDGDVSFTIPGESLEGNRLAGGPNVGGYTVTATKDGSLNYLDASATFDFSINKISQALLEPSGVLTSYPYKDTIYLDTSGGTDNGDVSFSLVSDYGPINLVDGKRVEEDISVGLYTLTAIKDGSLNYLDASFSIDINVNQIGQEPFSIINPIDQYDYLRDITFDISGGSGDGDVSFTIPGESLEGNSLSGGT